MKTALITGASGGIGLAMTDLFLESGYSVVAHSRGPSKELQALARDHGHHLTLIRGDFSSVKGIEAFLKVLKRKAPTVDVLVNNAGLIAGAAPFTSIKATSLEAVFSVNFKAPFLLSQYCLPAMKHRGWGRIINISSVGVKFGGSSQTAHYSAAKAALEALTRSLSKEGAPRGVLVNTLRIGVTDTALHRSVPGKKMAARRKLIPLGRMAHPTEIAEAALFLASEESSFVAGSVLEATGGE